MTHVRVRPFSRSSAVRCVAALTVFVTVAVTFAASAMAQDIGYRLRNSVNKGEKPAIILQPNEPIRRVIIELTRSDGKKIRVTKKKLRPGKEVVVALKQGLGRMSYKGTMTIVAKNGQKTQGALDFDAIVAAKVRVELDTDVSSVEKKQVVFKANALVDKGEIVLYDGSDNEVARHEYPFAKVRPGKPLVMGWTTDADVKRVSVKLYDPAGTWTSVELRPFWIDIPHDDVGFDTGKASFHASEQKKLDDALEAIGVELAKIQDAGSSLVVNLYIGGYTDTVGNNASNQALSERRARAIAAYFAKRGLRIPIYYQGFGEEGQAVKTGDEVDEAKNRRALYMLANVSPPLSDQIPRSRWRRLR